MAIRHGRFEVFHDDQPAVPLPDSDIASQELSGLVKRDPDVDGGSTPDPHTGGGIRPGGPADPGAGDEPAVRSDRPGVSS